MFRFGSVHPVFLVPLRQTKKQKKKEEKKAIKNLIRLFVKLQDNSFIYFLSLAI